jgi:hypothetical protein
MDLAPLGLPKEKAFGWHRNPVVLPLARYETRGHGDELLQYEGRQRIVKN